MSYVGSVVDTNVWALTCDCGLWLINEAGSAVSVFIPSLGYSTLYRRNIEIPRAYSILFMWVFE
uniref:Transmembrane protein n=1 Tax=Mesocestoides corti TaxID=53468 RepID=A0A5K3F6Y9_MESCO